MEQGGCGAGRVWSRGGCKRWPTGQLVSQHMGWELRAGMAWRMAWERCQGGRTSACEAFHTLLLSTAISHALSDCYLTR